MKISVVIPTHDRARVLPRALDSVRAQRRPADEVILVDDGSTDGTAELVQSRYPGIRYLHQANRGVSSARNRGIHAARGDWIALLDSDDAWHPDKLAAQIHALQAAPGHRLCHSDEIWIRRGVRVNPMHKHAKAGGNIFLRCLPRCVISPSSVLIERSLLDEVGLFDEALPACEDYDLWLRVCAREPVLFVERALITKYGGHDDQLSRRHPAMDRFRVQALEKLLRKTPLTAADRHAAIETLVKKLAILHQGAAKRGRPEACHYAQRLRHWRRGLRTRTDSVTAEAS